MIARLLIGVIRAYQKTLSPDHGLLRVFFPHGACRYTPSCSQYCLEAWQRYGVRGLRLCVRRVVSCHPYAQGGYDQVPDLRKQNSKKDSYQKYKIVTKLYKQTEQKIQKRTK